MIYKVISAGRTVDPDLLGQFILIVFDRSISAAGSG